MNPDVAQSDLPVLRARHELANALLRYLRAVDDRDIDGVLAELSHATVSFGGPDLRGDEELIRAYERAFATGGRTRHLLHEVEVAVEVADPDAGADGTDVIAGRAAYQRWSLDTDPPTITALGHYQVRLAADSNPPHLTVLTVHRDWQHTRASLAPTTGRKKR